MAELLLVNPRRRRRRKGGVRRRMSALQRRFFGGKRRRRPRVVGKRRRRRASSFARMLGFGGTGRKRHRRRSTVKRRRHRRRSPKVQVVQSNPIRFRRLRRNPIVPTSADALTKTLTTAAIGAAGAIGVDYAMTSLPIPYQFTTGSMYWVTRIAAAFGLGWLVSQMANEDIGVEVSAGGLIVTVYDYFTQYLNQQSGYAYSYNPGGAFQFSMGMNGLGRRRMGRYLKGVGYLRRRRMAGLGRMRRRMNGVGFNTQRPYSLGFIGTGKVLNGMSRYIGVR